MSVTSELLILFVRRNAEWYLRPACLSRRNILSKITLAHGQSANDQNPPEAKSMDGLLGRVA